MHVDDIKLSGMKQNIHPMWKVLNDEVDWKEKHFSLTKFTWCVLKDSEINVRSQNFRWSSGKITMLGKPEYRNVWNDVVSWQTRIQNNSTKYLLRA